jgi:glutamyl-tRNA synthetase
MSSVRVRFAPSPTGALHIGGLRTALYNYLLAQKTGGTFILRIEDTDQARYVPGAEEYIIESLKWCGILPTEGPGIGGDYGPYRQSERKDMYGQYAQQLVDSGNAYYAFDSAEELDKMRTDYESRKETFRYDSSTRVQLNNSLTISAEEVKTRLESGVPYVIRLKIPRDEEVSFNDLIRGQITFQSNEVDDKIILKGDGMPTYHLANIVDDYFMKISHVIRGEEW